MSITDKSQNVPYLEELLPELSAIYLKPPVESVWTLHAAQYNLSPPPEKPQPSHPTFTLKMEVAGIFRTVRHTSEKDNVAAGISVMYL
jgi:hypothetical protein